MKRYSNTQSKIQSNRTGFTLIELMVVIGLIAILASLLLVAVGSGRDSAKRAEVKAELAAIESGLSGFASDFGGQYPPSRIVLYEAPADWTAKSKSTIRSLWGSFDFSIGRDFNDNGSFGESGVSVTLEGSECLIFFLGGVSATDSAGRIYTTGFSRNPADPFDATSQNRRPPYFDFDPSRIKGSGDAIVYFDKFSEQTSPIWYLSSYGGRGYRNADLPDSMKTSDLDTDSNPDGNGVYKQGDQSDSPAWKADSYQLISPGRDGEYGLGGVYSSDGTVKFNGKKNDPANNNPGEADKDNITNFSSGTLD